MEDEIYEIKELLRLYGSQMTSATDEDEDVTEEELRKLEEEQKGLLEEQERLLKDEQDLSTQLLTVRPHF